MEKNKITITTIPVSIKVMEVGGKKLTLSVFKQIHSYLNLKSMTAINVNKIIQDLIEDTAILIAQRTDKETELECLKIGKEAYSIQQKWDKVVSYDRAMQAVQRDIDTLNELITPRLSEVRRAQAIETNN
jgi:hypothetical protein